MDNTGAHVVKAVSMTSLHRLYQEVEMAANQANARLDSIVAHGHRRYDPIVLEKVMEDVLALTTRVRMFGEVLHG